MGKVEKEYLTRHPAHNLPVSPVFGRPAADSTSRVQIAESEIMGSAPSGCHQQESTRGQPTTAQAAQRTCEKVHFILFGFRAVHSLFVSYVRQVASPSAACPTSSSVGVCTPSLPSKLVLLLCSESNYNLFHIPSVPEFCSVYLFLLVVPLSIHISCLPVSSVSY